MDEPDFVETVERDHRRARDRRHAGHHRNQQQPMRDARAKRSLRCERGVVVQRIPIAADRAEECDVGLGHSSAASAGENIADAELIEVLVQQNGDPSTDREAPKSYTRRDVAKPPKQTLVSQYNLPVRFAGQTAIVTGAGRGMGRSIAIGLAAEGANVVVADVDQDAAADTVAEIQSAQGQAMSVVTDVSKVDDVRLLFKTAIEAFGGVAILVNNAGIGIPKPLLDYTEADWDKQLGVNLKGMFFATQEAARVMIPKRRGKIVNFASTAAFVSSSTPETAYDISKGGVRQLTISVAAELAPHHINVNAVAPGTIMTELTLKVLDTEEKMARASAKIPMGRLGKPEDMVGPVLFLCSDEADYVTGHTLVVDGGWLLF